MQVNTNFYQPNFQGLNFKILGSASVEKEVKDILYKKLPKQEVNSFLKILDESPVETTLGVADGKKFDRLDAMIFYKHPGTEIESFEYVEESKMRNLFGIKPRNFINKVLMKVESVEETFQTGRYA